MDDDPRLRKAIDGWNMSISQCERLEREVQSLKEELRAEKTRSGMLSAGWKETIRQLSVWQKIADDLATELTLEQNPGYRCAALSTYDQARSMLPFATRPEVTP